MAFPFCAPEVIGARRLSLIPKLAVCDLSLRPLQPSRLRRFGWQANLDREGGRHRAGCAKSASRTYRQLDTRGCRVACELLLRSRPTGGQAASLCLAREPAEIV